MSKDTDGLVIELELDPEGERRQEPAKDDQRRPDVEAKAEKADIVTPQKGNDEAVESLRQQLQAMQAERDAERARRAAAEEDASKLAGGVRTARATADQARYDAVNSHIAQAKARADALKKDIKAALEAGDAEKAATHQMEAATVAARLIQYEDHKADLEYRAQAQQQQQREQPQTQETQRQPTFEDRISSLSEPSKAWLRNHPECVTDDVSNAKVMWAHKDALKRGLAADSEAYFKHLENQMGYARPGEDDDVDQEEIVPAPKPNGRMPAAPPSRGSSRPDPVTGHLGNGKYQMTREEADIAEAMGLTHAEYVTNKLKMIKEGRWANN